MKLFHRFVLKKGRIWMLDTRFSILVIPAKTVTKSWSSLVNAEGIRDTKYEIQPALSAVEWERRIIFEMSWGNGYNNGTTPLMKRQKTEMMSCEDRRRMRVFRATNRVQKR